MGKTISGTQQWIACAVLIVSTTVSAQITVSPDLGYQRDPNFPAPGMLAGERGRQIEWAYPNGSVLPNVHLRLNSRPTADVSSYFGYNEDGSWINNPEDGKIYVWNFKSKSLTVRYNNFKEVPKELYASLRNPQKEYFALHNNRDGAPQTARAPSKSADNSRAMSGDAGSASGVFHDPNFPTPGRIAGQRGAQILWEFGGGGDEVPVIYLIFNGHSNNDNSSYFGYNAEGSFIKNPNDGSIYVWNLTTNTLSKRYGNFREIPKDVLAGLMSPQKVYAAHSNKDGPPQTAPAPPKAVDNSRAMLGDPTNALNALKASASTNTAIPGAGFNGTGAKIESGMLIFTATGGSTASYKVVRPKVMAANSQAATEITGSWISMEDGGKAILFTVQTDGSVTGKEMPAAVIQMLVH